jgi:hypothetical protein
MNMYAHPQNMDKTAKHLYNLDFVLHSPFFQGGIRAGFPISPCISVWTLWPKLGESVPQPRLLLPSDLHSRTLRHKDRKQL